MKRLRGCKNRNRCKECGEIRCFCNRQTKTLTDPMTDRMANRTRSLNERLADGFSMIGGEDGDFWDRLDREEG